MAKKKIGLLFGGCSGEHEVSIISAKAIASALSDAENTSKYEIIPVYIDKDGFWRSSDIAQQVLTSGEALQLSAKETTSLTSSTSSQSSTSLVAGFNNLTQTSQNPQIAEIDVWFPILHGPNGEDGTIQGLLKLMQVPFVGSGVLGSALGMDKIAMKNAFAQAGLPQVKYAAVTRSQIWSNPCSDARSLASYAALKDTAPHNAGSHRFPKLCDEIEAIVDYPCFVKPANLGSSVGIAKVRSRNELETALDNAASYDRRIIIEAGVNAKEVECAVLGNDNPKASVVGEISFNSDFYDYETKYTEGLAQLQIPAQIPDAIASQIQEMSLKAFTAIDAAGLARVDFFYVEATQEVFINEINTFPGFTSTSMYPRLWAATGISFPNLVDRLIQLALERYQELPTENRE